MAKKLNRYSAAGVPDFEIVSYYPESLLADVWQLPDAHIPEYLAQGWHDYIPNCFEAQLLSFVRSPVNSHEFLELPRSWRRLNALDRLRIAGKVTIQTLIEHKPLYHKCLVGSRILETRGTTIIVTAAAKQHGIVMAPWSAGEQFGTVLKRIFHYRGGLHSPSPSTLCAMNGYLPAAQAVVSVVPQDRPFASLFGSGGAVATEVCCGNFEVGFTSLHQIFYPQDGKIFSDTWIALLRSALRKEK